MSANAGLYDDSGAMRVVGGSGGGSAGSPTAPGYVEVVSDTANVASSYPIGTQADTAYSGTGSGSLVSVLKGLYVLNAGTMAVRPQLAAAFTPGQVGVTTVSTSGAPATGQLILASTAATTPREIKNTGTVTVYIGPTTTINSSTGYPILANESFTPWWTGAIYGCIAAAGTAIVGTCV